MEVQSRGPFGAQADFSLRGATFQQVLVILDGVRLNDPLTGHFNSYIPLNPSEIERIEILKGASSALYGTEAVGGVINIITKSFSNSEEGKFRKASIELGKGEYQLLKNRFSLEAGGSKNYLSAAYLQNKTDGQLLRGSRSFLNMQTLSLSARHRFSANTSIAYRFAKDDRDFNAQNFYTQFLSDTATERVGTWWHQLRFQHRQGKHQIQVDAGWKKTSDAFQFNRLSTKNSNHSGVGQAQVNHQFPLGEKATLSSGLQWISRSVESNNRGNHRIAHAGFFSSLNQGIGEAFHVNPALRIDYNERSGLQILPQLNASWKWNGFQLRGSAGRSTRDADFTERFNNYQPALVKSGGRMGNPDLLAEQSWNVEAGADWFSSHDLRISFSGFQRFHRNLIDYETTAYQDMPRKDNLESSGTYLLAKNLGSVVTRGLELDAWMKKSFSAKQSLEGSAGLVLMESLSSGKTPSLYVSNHARFLANGNISYRFGPFGLSASALYKVRSSQEKAGLLSLSPDYFLLNLRSECHFDDSLLAYFQADNALNASYTDILGPRMPGRWLSGGIRVNLRK
jgi:iron complex outermembrane receptor protein